jgi:uncharacterized protein YdeI (YjbR/CyaY-like superfamily)
MPKKPTLKTEKGSNDQDLVCDIDDNVMAIKAASKEVTANPNFLHEMPADLNELLDKNVEVKLKWDTLTALAKNEWICWVTIVKKEETRKEHLARLCKDLLDGKKRPCCWPGCPHRRKSAGKWFK